MHHYTACGLKNVWLDSGYIERDTPYGPTVAGEDVAALHERIALEIVESKPHLTGPEFRFLRKYLEMSQKHLAGIIGNDSQTVARWEKRGRVPKWGERILRVLVRQKTDGDADLLKLIENLNNLDRIKHELQLAYRPNQGWYRQAAA